MIPSEMRSVSSPSRQNFRHATSTRCSLLSLGGGTGGMSMRSMIASLDVFCGMFASSAAVPRYLVR